MPPTPPITVRLATESDLPALLSILLTSFRQSPLFAFLYSPLDTDLSAAHDTIFFWRRRLLLDLLDPSTTILVAEMAPDAERNERPKSTDGREMEMSSIVRESWRMLGWVEEEAWLNQESGVDGDAEEGRMVVGFAIWGVRVGHAAVEEEKERLAPRAVDWRTTMRGMKCLGPFFDYLN
jgi:hypothetical protein